MKKERLKRKEKEKKKPRESRHFSNPPMSPFRRKVSKRGRKKGKNGRP